MPGSGGSSETGQFILRSSWPGLTRPSSGAFRLRGGSFGVPSNPRGMAGWVGRRSFRREKSRWLQEHPSSDLRFAPATFSLKGRRGGFGGISGWVPAFAGTARSGAGRVLGMELRCGGLPPAIDTPVGTSSQFVMAGLDPAIQPRLPLARRAFLAPRVKPGGDEGRDGRFCATFRGGTTSQDGSRLSPGQRDRGSGGFGNGASARGIGRELEIIRAPHTRSLPRRRPGSSQRRFPRARRVFSPPPEGAREGGFVRG